MTFQLTDKLTEEILFSMEDQDSKFILDASAGVVIAADDYAELEGLEVDEELFYSLPKWTSQDGYAVLEEFIAQLKAVDARKDLQRVMASGRGVFRNYKDALKKYPEVEPNFFAFKKNKMKARLTEWYNSLIKKWESPQCDLL